MTATDQLVVAFREEYDLSLVTTVGDGGDNLAPLFFPSSGLFPLTYPDTGCISGHAVALGLPLDLWFAVVALPKENVGVRDLSRLTRSLSNLSVGVANATKVVLPPMLAAQMPDAKVIGMGLVPTQADVVEFVSAGASGFILKSASVKDFLGTSRSIAQGAKILPPSLTDSLFSHVVALELAKKKGKPASIVRMTKREREIIALIADGLSNKEIAQRLNIATHTVKSHVHNVIEKLALHTRLQIAKFIHDDNA